MDGEAFIRRMTAEGLARISDAKHGPGEMLVPLLFHELKGAARALIAAGHLDGDRWSDLEQEVEDQLVQQGLIQPWRVSMGFDFGTATAGVKGGGDAGGARDLAKPAEAEAPELLRVLPLVQELELPSKRGRMLLVSLEIWSNHMELRVAQQSREPRRRLSPFRPDEGLRWRAWDDAGTFYQPGGGGGSGGRFWFHRHYSFKPSPPPEATELTLRLDDDEGVEVAGTTVELSDNHADGI